MANNLKIDPTKINYAWSTNTTYKIALGYSVVKEVGGNRLPSPAVPVASIFTTFTDTIFVSTVSPVYATSASLTSTFALTFNRYPVQNTIATNTNFYLYNSTGTSTSLVASIPSTSSLLSVTGTSITFDLTNFMDPDSTYYMTGDAGVVTDIFGVVFPGIANDSIFKWTTQDGITVADKSYFYDSSGLILTVRAFVMRPLEAYKTTSSYYYIYKEDGSLYRKQQFSYLNTTTNGYEYGQYSTNNYWTFSTGTVFFGNYDYRGTIELRIWPLRSGFFGIAPEGKYYINWDGAALKTGSQPWPGAPVQPVYTGTQSILTPLRSTSTLAFNHIIIKDADNYTFNTGTNYFFTATTSTISQHIVPSTQVPLTFSITSPGGYFGHATSGTTVGNSWTITTKPHVLDSLFAGVYFVGTATTNTTYSYTLTWNTNTVISGTLITTLATNTDITLVNKTKNLTYQP